ncbi:uncharacterized protein UV8b_07366 [Ustilaginoidea virens]|uniref:Uncharacterized protein n=1 Tax=Ustilaginoidea virens TaxID=1159556 RepID=A0A8E5HWX3_USTVR|nr:uncharacterized protein UV8b_07366 [Ustilaginoidea virens]QUC23125.1 hypothetical protein UV8b_07366 [Ustilaginoidea virens]
MGGRFPLVTFVPVTIWFYRRRPSEISNKSDAASDSREGASQEAAILPSFTTSKATGFCYERNTRVLVACTPSDTCGEARPTRHYAGNACYTYTQYSSTCRDDSRLDRWCRNVAHVRHGVLPKMAKARAEEARGQMADAGSGVTIYTVFDMSAATHLELPV